MKNFKKLTITLLILITTLTACTKQTAPTNLSSNTQMVKSNQQTNSKTTATTSLEQPTQTSKPQNTSSTKVKTNNTSTTSSPIIEQQTTEVATEIPRPFQALEDEVIALLNIEREKAGLNTLNTYNKYYHHAKLRAEECEQYWSHTRPNGESWSSLYKNDKTVTNIRHIGENLGKQFIKAETIVQALMNSESHRAAILNPNYTAVCVAIIEMQPLEEYPNKTLYAMAQHFYNLTNN